MKCSLDETTDHLVPSDNNEDDCEKENDSGSDEQDLHNHYADQQEKNINNESDALV